MAVEVIPIFRDPISSTRRAGRAADRGDGREKYLLVKDHGIAVTDKTIEDATVRW